MNRATRKTTTVLGITLMVLRAPLAAAQASRPGGLAGVVYDQTGAS